MDAEEFEFSEVKIKKEKEVKNRHECLACGKYISDRRNLVRHLRKIHCIEPTVRKPQLKCSFKEDCKFLCATSEHLREHLKKVHDFHVEKIVLNFKSKTDFEKWKQEEEEKKNARYVSYTGTKCRGTKKIYYLKCHRSGSVRQDNNSIPRKRSKPLKGYTQCGATCPSSLTVAESANGNIQVIYFPVHLGHTLDDESIPYMKLTTKEKEEIVGKLAQGEPVGKIVSDARKIKGSKLCRLNFLQRRDVYNIKKKINYLEKESDHDGREIDSWVRALGAQGPPKGPVALYTPPHPSHDYCLVLIHFLQKATFSVLFDGSIVYVKTKRGKANVDLNVVCVSVVCENGEGYPIAFCVTQKTEYITLLTFFKIVYQNFGMIKTQIFVSDNIGHYYLAWKNVMGECDNKLICTFDMESYWEQKLTALKCPVGKQKTASAELKLLLEQPDKDEFESQLLKMLCCWEDDDDMKLFSSFFQKFYVKKRFEWATCYRIHSTRKESINRYLEPINAALNVIHEESYNSVKKALNLLLSFVRDVCLLKLLSWDERTAEEKALETGRRHEEGMSVGGVRRSSGSEWVVSEGGSEFVVRKGEKECEKKCGLYCESCDICVHEYWCDCSDYVVEFNICRHLHAIGSSTGEKKPKDSKNFSKLTSKYLVIKQAKSFAEKLEKSNLCEEEYKKIGATLSSLESIFSKVLSKS